MYNMKQLITLLLLAVVCKVQAQQPFEGTIVYRMESNTKPSDTFSLTVKFGKKAIWIKYPKKGPGGADEVLVDLEAGKVFELEMGEKGYVSKNLFKKENLEQSVAVNQIAGHKVKTIDLSNKGISGLIAGMSRSQVLIYSSEDLYYPIPPAYNSNIALSMVYDNKILLGLTIIDRPPYEGAVNDTLHLKAESVIQEVFAADAFKIPAGFAPLETEPVQLPPPAAPVEIEKGIADEEGPVVVEAPPIPLEPAPPIKSGKKKTTTTKKKTTGTKAAARKP